VKRKYLGSWYCPTRHIWDDIWFGENEWNGTVNRKGRVTIWGEIYKLFLKKFPLNKQTCSNDLHSWTRSWSFIRLVNLNADWRPQDHSILEKREWSLQNVKVIKETKIVDTEKWDHVICVLEIERKPYFHMLNSRLPVCWYRY
jgi:hypothetical protein